MKLVYVTTLYTDYINGVYGKSPDLSLQNYEYQKTILDYDSFFKHLSYYLPGSLKDNIGFVTWLRTTDNLPD